MFNPLSSFFLTHLLQLKLDTPGAVVKHGYVGEKLGDIAC